LQGPLEYISGAMTEAPPGSIVQVLTCIKAIGAQAWQSGETAFCFNGR
jgi:hypothetical protein